MPKSPEIKLNDAVMNKTGNDFKRLMTFADNNEPIKEQIQFNFGITLIDLVIMLTNKLSLGKSGDWFSSNNKFSCHKYFWILYIVM